MKLNLSLIIVVTKFCWLEQKAALAAAKGLFEDAFHLSQQYIQQHQQWRSEETEQRLFRLRHQFEIERTEFENQLLQQHNQHQEVELKMRRNRQYWYTGATLSFSDSDCFIWVTDYSPEARPSSRFKIWQ